MKITIKEESDNLILEFVPYGTGRRLWIRSADAWYPSVGWCPHLNIGYGECRDCALVLDED